MKDKITKKTNELPDFLESVEDPQDGDMITFKNKDYIFNGTVKQKTIIINEKRKGSGFKKVKGKEIELNDVYVLGKLKKNKEIIPGKLNTFVKKYIIDKKESSENKEKATDVETFKEEIKQELTEKLSDKEINDLKTEDLKARYGQESKKRERLQKEVQEIAQGEREVPNQKTFLETQIKENWGELKGKKIWLGDGTDHPKKFHIRIPLKGGGIQLVESGNNKKQEGSEHLTINTFSDIKKFKKYPDAQFVSETGSLEDGKQLTGGEEKNIKFRNKMLEGESNRKETEKRNYIEEKKAEINTLGENIKKCAEELEKRKRIPAITNYKEKAKQAFKKAIEEKKTPQKELIEKFKKKNNKPAVIEKKEDDTETKEKAPKKLEPTTKIIPETFENTEAKQIGNLENKDSLHALVINGKPILLNKMKKPIPTEKGSIYIKENKIYYHPNQDSFVKGKKTEEEISIKGIYIINHEEKHTEESTATMAMKMGDDFTGANVAIYNKQEITKVDKNKGEIVKVDNGKEKLKDFPKLLMESELSFDNKNFEPQKVGTVIDLDTITDEKVSLDIKVDGKPIKIRKGKLGERSLAKGTNQIKEGEFEADKGTIFIKKDGDKAIISYTPNKNELKKDDIYNVEIVLKSGEDIIGMGDKCEITVKGTEEASSQDVTPKPETTEQEPNDREALDEMLKIEATTFDMYRKAAGWNPGGIRGGDPFNNTLLGEEIARDFAEQEAEKREEIEKNSSTLFGRTVKLGRHGMTGRHRKRRRTKNAAREHKNAGGKFTRDPALQNKIKSTADYLQTGHGMLDGASYELLGSDGIYENIPELNAIATNIVKNGFSSDADAIRALNNLIENPPTGKLKELVENYEKANIPKRAIGSNLFEQIKSQTTEKKELLELIDAISIGAGKEKLKAYVTKHGRAPGPLHGFIMTKASEDQKKKGKLTPAEINELIDNKLTTTDLKNLQTKMKSFIAAQRMNTNTASIKVRLVAFKTKKIKSLAANNLEDQETKGLNKIGRMFAKFPMLTKFGIWGAVIGGTIATGGSARLLMAGGAVVLRALINSSSTRYETQKEAKELLNKAVAQGLDLQKMVKELEKTEQAYKKPMGKFFGKVFGRGAYTRIHKKLQAAKAALGKNTENKLGEGGLTEVQGHINILKQDPTGKESEYAAQTADILARLDAHAQTGRQFIHTKNQATAESERRDLMVLLQDTIVNAIINNNAVLMNQLGIDPTIVTDQDRAILSNKNHSLYKNSLNNFVTLIKTNNNTYKQNLHTYVNVKDKAVIENLTKEMNRRARISFRQKIVSGAALLAATAAVKEGAEFVADAIQGDGSTVVETLNLITNSHHGNLVPGSANATDIATDISTALANKTLNPGDTMSRDFSSGVDGLSAGSSFITKLGDAIDALEQFKELHPNLFSEEGRAEIEAQFGENNLEAIQQAAIDMGASPGNAALNCTRAINENMVIFQELANKGGNGLNLDLNWVNPTGKIDLTPTGNAPFRMMDISNLNLIQNIKGPAPDPTELPSRLYGAAGLASDDEKSVYKKPGNPKEQTPSPEASKQDPKNEPKPQPQEGKETKPNHKTKEIKESKPKTQNNLEKGEEKNNEKLKEQARTLLEGKDNKDTIYTKKNKKKIDDLRERHKNKDPNAIKETTEFLQKLEKKCTKLEKKEESWLKNYKNLLIQKYPELINKNTNIKIASEAMGIDFKGKKGFYNKESTTLYLNYDIIKNNKIVEKEKIKHVKEKPNAINLDNINDENNKTGFSELFGEMDINNKTIKKQIKKEGEGGVISRSTNELRYDDETRKKIIRGQVQSNTKSNKENAKFITMFGESKDGEQKVFTTTNEGIKKITKNYKKLYKWDTETNKFKEYKEPVQSKEPSS